MTSRLEDNKSTLASTTKLHRVNKLSLTGLQPMNLSSLSGLHGCDAIDRAIRHFGTSRQQEAHSNAFRMVPHDLLCFYM